MSEIKVTPESFRTSLVTPIELSKTKHTQTSFAIKQVDNPNDPRKNLKGTLTIKKRCKDGPQFDEDEKFSRRSIKSNELVEITFTTEETYKLGEGLFKYYRLLGGKYTNPYDEITYIEKDERIEHLRELLQNKEDLYEAIAKIDISTLNIALNIENLRRIKAEMESNMENDGEISFWQSFFTKNAWILAQLFHAPVMFYENMKYVGGKSISNHGGQYPDLVYKNDLTDNIAIIEIKSPVKPLLGKCYRQTYSLSDELSGGINQLLKQKQTLYHSYANLVVDLDKKFEANNIECILLIGSIKSLTREQQRIFDTYRNELRSVKIVCFDELLHRIDNQITLLEKV